MPDPIRVLYVEEAATDPVRAPQTSDGEVTFVSVETAASALDRIDTGGVDCVVSGQDLPDSTGVELLERVRDRDSRLPFILYTDIGISTLAERAIQAGITDYLHRDPGTDQTGELVARITGAVERSARTSIEATQERFRTIIEQSSDVVSILDRDGAYLYQSPSVEAVLGYDPDEFVDQTVYDFVHPDDREQVRTEFRAAVEDPGRTPTVEYRFEHADGSWRVVESRGTNMLDDPVVEGLVVNTRDVTDRRRRDQRMNVLNRTLRHDLRNSMNVVLGNAELLLRDYGNDDRAETVRRTAATMLELGNKVRDIEQALDTGGTTREMVDIVSVVEAHLAAVERSRPDVAVETDLPESEWVLANGQIGSAIDDAVRNALEHNDADDPLLRVTTEEAELTGDDAVTVVIADNGPGIPDEELDVLTQGGETPLEHASGLGLWLIKWIVNESAGDLSFEESPEGGTAVRITLEKAHVSQRIDLD